MLHTDAKGVFRRDSVTWTGRTIDTCYCVMAAQNDIIGSEFDKLYIV